MSPCAPRFRVSVFKFTPQHRTFLKINFNSKVLLRGIKCKNTGSYKLTQSTYTRLRINNYRIHSKHWICDGVKRHEFCSILMVSRTEVICSCSLLCIQ